MPRELLSCSSWSEAYSGLVMGAADRGFRTGGMALLALSVIPGEWLPWFSGSFPVPGISAGHLVSGGHGRGGAGVCGGERRAVVWPVSCLVRGRAWPGGLTLAGGAGPLADRPWLVRPGPPDLPGEGPAPGRWVKNRTERHLAPGLYGGHRARRTGTVRRSRGHSHAPPQSHETSGAPSTRMGTLRDDCATGCPCAEVLCGGRKKAVIAAGAVGGSEPGISADQDGGPGEGGGGSGLG